MKGGGVVAEEQDFDGFVAARRPALVKAAWLLTGDWHTAEDLLQTALAKAYLAWARIQPGNEEAYVRRVLVTTYATWWRRAWRREVPHADPAEHQPPQGQDSDLIGVEVRRALVDALSTLTRRQRATVVLRYYCDLSEAEAADAMGCSVGTVKSQAAKGLARLRATPLAEASWEGMER